MLWTQRWRKRAAHGRGGELARGWLGVEMTRRGGPWPRRVSEVRAARRKEGEARQKAALAAADLKMAGRGGSTVAETARR